MRELNVGDVIQVPVSHTDRMRNFVIDRITPTQYVCGSKRFRKRDLGVVGAKFPQETRGYLPEVPEVPEVLEVLEVLEVNAKCTIDINSARMARVVEVGGCETPYVVVNMDSKEVVYAANYDGVSGYIAGAQGAWGITAKLAIYSYESLRSNFVVAGSDYIDPDTYMALWLLGNPSITDDGEHYAATAVDINGDTYRIEWVRIDPHCEDEGNACDWDDYIVIAS